MKTRKFKIKIAKPNEDRAEAMKRRFSDDWKRVQRGLKPKDSEYDIILTFPDSSWITKIVSPERMRIYQTIKDHKPESIYELAKLLGRAVANVQRDVNELAELGVIELKRKRKKGQKRETIEPQYNWDGFDIAV